MCVCVSLLSARLSPLPHAHLQVAGSLPVIRKQARALVAASVAATLKGSGSKHSKDAAPLQLFAVLTELVDKYMRSDSLVLCFQLDVDMRVEAAAAATAAAKRERSAAAAAPGLELSFGSRTPVQPGTHQLRMSYRTQTGQDTASLATGSALPPVPPGDIATAKDDAATGAATATPSSTTSSRVAGTPVTSSAARSPPLLTGERQTKRMAAPLTFGVQFIMFELLDDIRRAAAVLLAET